MGGNRRIEFIHLSMYNPFLPFTETVYRELTKTGFCSMVIQRMVWPGISTGTGFLVTAYNDQLSASTHARQLDTKEGKILDSHVDKEKVIQLLSASPSLHFFLATFKEENWDKKMIKEYEPQIVNYLKSRTTFKRRDTIQITFFLEFGRVKASISNEDITIIRNATDLII